MNDFFVEATGIAGALAVLIAYGLNSYKRIKPDSWTFIALNLTGAGLLIVYSIAKDAWANMFINVVWVMIAVGSIVRILRQGK